jgi:hypothetical protein
MAETGTTNLSQTPRLNWGVTIALVALIALVHGAFGLLYAHLAFSIERQVVLCNGLRP